MTTRKQRITGNWKMNLALDEALELARGIRNRVRAHVDSDVAVCPPYPYLEPIAQLLKDSPVQVGAQDMDAFASGARTGAVSGPMLRSVGCSFTLVGHSERRAIFGDTNEIVSAKLRAALEHDLDVTLCVGESLEQREAGTTFDVVLEQVESALSTIQAGQMNRIVVAYEPVWAIGTGHTATPAQAQEVHARIRSHIGHLYDADIANSLNIQYGGSVKPDNAATLKSQPDVDGALVGGASLDPESFIQIIRT
ncbi:MAG: triose-phosphate isomerase [Myxococcales bacterium]|nr:triose-phosphate isomerase [Myxococcales bacterium]